ncbi:MAG TPA: cytochrome c3 family protein [Povalibacter sp.]|nr:cytochrome c3 family protein [Povalibacter sp.]
MRRLLIIAAIAIAAAGMFVGRKLEPAPTSLDHNTHGGIDCIDCHHDLMDGNNMGAESGMTCKGCHSGNPDLRARLRTDFHGLCRSCHARERLVPTHRLLPVARCSGCHSGPHR